MLRVNTHMPHCNLRIRLLLIMLRVNTHMPHCNLRIRLLLIMLASLGILALNTPQVCRLHRHLGVRWGHGDL
jgi:hypothetical protein